MNDAGYIPRLYGRKQAQPLKARHADLIATLLPRIATPTLGRIDPAALFPDAEELQLEAGFGGGEHLVWQAAQNPNTGFIGAESFINGVAKLLVLVEDQKLDNVRVHHGDVRPLLEALPEASLSKIYVLHPDPWPKKRHYKRRLISPWFFDEAARVLKQGGELRVASDIRDYIRWTLMHAQNAPAFEWTAENAASWKTRPGDWPQTRYEVKSLREGRTPAYLTFRRKRH